MGPVSMVSADSDTDSAGRAAAAVQIEGLGTAEMTVSLCANADCVAPSSQDSVLLPIVHSDPPRPHCDDGVDNDYDGDVDFPADAECRSAEDDSEAQLSSGTPDWFITIRYDADPAAFTGAIRAPYQRCLLNRLVRVKRVRTGPDRVIASDRTSRRGHWYVSSRKRRGRFYAVVRGATRSTRDGEIRCRRGRSVTIRLR